MNEPVRVVFAAHALERIQQRSIGELQVADVVLAQHLRRRRNPGSAEWIVRGSGLVVVYNWPDVEDETTAYVISAWHE